MEELAKAVAMEAVYQAIKRLGGRGRIVLAAVYRDDWSTLRTRQLAVELQMSQTPPGATLDARRRKARGV
jgi:hypothetical protein